MYIRLHVKYPLFLSEFNETWIFSTELRKVLNLHILRKSVLWQPSCSMRMGGHVDITKLTVVFRNFTNAARNAIIFYRPRWTAKHHKSDTWFES